MTHPMYNASFLWPTSFSMHIKVAQPLISFMNSLKVLITYCSLCFYVHHNPKKKQYNIIAQSNPLKN